MQDQLNRLGALRDGQDVREVVERVVVSRRLVQVRLAGRANVPLHANATGVSYDGDQLLLTIQAMPTWRGGSKTAIGPGGAPAVSAPAVDRALLKGLVRAETWKWRIVHGEATLETICQHDGVNRNYAQRLVRLAFMKPDVKRAILDEATRA